MGVAADEFYCIKLLENTGLVVVPGSGFKQVQGTYHFRTTFLPPDSMLDEVLPKLKTFQQYFIAQYDDAHQEPAVSEQSPSSAEITPEATPKPTGQGHGQKKAVHPEAAEGTQTQAVDVAIPVG